MTDIIKNLAVYPEKMKENINVSRGLIFSQSILLALTGKNISREQAYKWVQRNSFKAWKEKKEFKDLVLTDQDIRNVLSKEEVKRCFSLQPFLEKIDSIFERVLTDES